MRKVLFKYYHTVSLVLVYINYKVKTEKALG